MKAHLFENVTYAAKALTLLVGAALVHNSFVSHAGAQEEFDANFFIEVNGSDEDAGVQLELDGEGWKYLAVINPLGDVILEIEADENESIGLQGLTELFFESAEPSFDDQTLAELFALFPEGDYEFEGETTEGDPITGTAEFTHNIPAIPEPEVKVFNKWDVRIKWMSVTDPYDDPNGAEVGDDIEIEGYRVVVEALDEEGEGLHTLDVELPATSLDITIPKEFLKLSPVREFKYEVIATEESGNQTIFEDEFALEDD